MHEHVKEIAGLETVVVAAASAAKINVVLLHGYAMQPQDLAPFAHSLKMAATFYLPRAPLPAPSGFSWWTLCESERLNALQQGPRDLATLVPDDLVAARITLLSFCEQIRAESASLPLIVCGFSQGGMLACDAVLCGGLKLDGLALLSASRIAFDRWLPHAWRLRELPVFIAHGTHDEDLAFAAGEALRDFHIASGARVTWLPFDGPHEIPLVVWRNLRGFLKSHLND